MRRVHRADCTGEPTITELAQGTLLVVECQPCGLYWTTPKGLL